VLSVAAAFRAMTKGDQRFPHSLLELSLDLEGIRACSSAAFVSFPPWRTGRDKGGATMLLRTTVFSSVSMVTSAVLTIRLLFKTTPRLFGCFAKPWGALRQKLITACDQKLLTAKTAKNRRKGRKENHAPKPQVAGFDFRLQPPVFPPTIPATGLRAFRRWTPTSVSYINPRRMSLGQDEFFLNDL
jgi:hypothetical protein